VRELMNRRAPISGFDRPSRASRDLGLLGSQRLASRAGRRAGGLGGALTGCLAGDQQLAAGTLGERLHPHCAQHLACDAQLVARLGDTALVAQPPAVEQARTGQLGTKPGPAKVEPITAGSVGTPPSRRAAPAN
jgi:hypothetical protein